MKNVCGEVCVPELDRYLGGERSYPLAVPFSERDKAVLRKYYGKVPFSQLNKHLERGRMYESNRREAKRYIDKVNNGG